MRTAESIIREYLDAGFSPESLRVLAESRPEPLCSEMLEIIRNLREPEVLDVDCVAAEPVENVGYGDMVFFVSSDEDTAAEETPIDFDVMAETVLYIPDDVPAAMEESVAEITVGETEGSELVSYDVAAEPPLEGAEKCGVESGVWSRRWSRARETEQDGAPEAAREDEVLAIGDAEPSFEDPAVDEQSVNDETEAVSSADELCDESPDALEPVGSEAESTEVAEVAEVSEVADASSNDGGFEDGGEADEIGAELSAVADDGTGAECARTDETSQEDQSPSLDLPAAPALVISPLTADFLVGKKDAQGKEKSLNRKERRRRERSEKKKAKTGKKKRAAGELPEIVLARSEGTETLVPEMAGDAAEACASDSADVPVAGSDSVVDAEEPAVASDGSEAGPVAADCPALSEPFVESAGESPECEVGEESGETPDVPPVSQESGDVLSLPMRFANGEGADESAFGADVDEWVDTGGDHLMIIAGGGLDLRDDAYRLLSDEFEGGNDYEPEGREAPQGNVILFRNHFVEPVDSGEEEAYEEAEPVLRMLPPAELEEEEAVLPALSDSGAVDGEESGLGETAAVAALPPIAQLGLLRALCGAPELADADAVDEVDAVGEHVIVAPVAEAPDDSAVEAEARAEMERDYQQRLDAFAARVLEAQAATAECEARIRERSAEVAAREAEIGEMRLRLAMGDERIVAKDGELAAVKKTLADREAELEDFSGLRTEHQRLYNEFEDLRRSYNEVVVDVMPKLQSERDDLTLTVERQCEEGDHLRASLRSSRRRLAAGYALGAAACLLMIALPVMNWMKADDGNRDLAMDHQQMTEIKDRMEKAEMRNVESEKALHDLERKFNLAQMELSRVEEKNMELVRIAEEQNRELASRSSRDGVPTRTSIMALQAVPQSGNPLRVNQVRDPGRRIEQTAAANRAERQRSEQRQDSQIAGRGRGRIPVSSVAPSDGVALRPPPAGSAESRGGVEVAQARSPARADASRQAETKAKVKAGEGVAQVVYRVLGTRDPEVIDWVIRENGIKKDRRGNPRIYPEQELRLPKGGTVSQTASR